MSFGQPLWCLDWAGNLRPLDSALPLFAVEQFDEFQDKGNVVRWYRSSTGPIEGYDPIDPELLGWHETDLTSGTARAIEEPQPCDDGEAQYMELDVDVIQTCDCSTGECRARELPSDPDAVSGVFFPGLETSPRARYGLVTYYDAMSAIPPSYPAAVLFDAEQDVMTSLPHSIGDFSRDERLLLLSPWGELSQIGIVELGTGAQTWMEYPWRSGIVYE